MSNRTQNRILAILTSLFVFASFLPLRKILNFADASRYGWYQEPLAISIYVADLIFIVFFICFVCRYFFLNHRLPAVASIFDQHSDLYIAVAIIIFFVAEASRNANFALGFYALIRLLQFFTLLLILPILVRHTSVRHWLCVSLVLLGLFQSFLGFYQVLTGHSLGLRYLGEQTISTVMPGVAKVSLADDGRLLRAYGTMPHPNILGGFLVLALFAALYLAKAPSKRSIFPILAALLIFLGIFATFSRTAIVSAVILVICVAQLSWSWQFRRLFALSTTTIFTFLCLIMLFIPQIRVATWNRVIPPTSDAFVSDRVLLIQNSLNVLKDSPFLGTGLGNYLPKLLERFPNGFGLEKWQYDYPHNVFITLLLERGIIGTLIFCYFSLTLFKTGTLKSSQIATIFIILSPILFFDHYLWTNQIGRVIFVLFIALTPYILKRSEKTADEKAHEPL